jgi:hypothetical protein
MSEEKGIITFQVNSEIFKEIQEEIWKRKIQNRSEAYREIFLAGYEKFKKEKKA